MRTTALIGGLCFTISLPSCTSPQPLLPASPTVIASTVVADRHELHDEAPPRQNLRARRKLLTARVKEMPPNVAAEDYRPTPNVGSPEWELAKKEDDEKERRLNRTIRSICRRC